MVYIKMQSDTSAFFYCLILFSINIFLIIIYNNCILIRSMIYLNNEKIIKGD